MVGKDKDTIRQEKSYISSKKLVLLQLYLFYTLNIENGTCKCCRYAECPVNSTRNEIWQLFFIGLKRLIEIILIIT